MKAMVVKGRSCLKRISRLNLTCNNPHADLSQPSTSLVTSLGPKLNLEQTKNRPDKLRRVGSLMQRDAPLPMAIPEASQFPKYSSWN